MAEVVRVKDGAWRYFDFVIALVAFGFFVTPALSQTLPTETPEEPLAETTMPVMPAMPTTTMPTTTMPTTPMPAVPVPDEPDGCNTTVAGATTTTRCVTFAGETKYVTEDIITNSTDPTGSFHEDTHLDLTFNWKEGSWPQTGGWGMKINALLVVLVGPPNLDISLREKTYYLWWNPVTSNMDEFFFSGHWKQLVSDLAGRDIMDTDYEYYEENFLGDRYKTGYEKLFAYDALGDLTRQSWLKWTDDASDELIDEKGDPIDDDADGQWERRIVRDANGNLIYDGPPIIPMA